LLALLSKTLWSNEFQWQGLWLNILTTNEITDLATTRTPKVPPYETTLQNGEKKSLLRLLSGYGQVDRAFDLRNKELHSRSLEAQKQIIALAHDVRNPLEVSKSIIQLRQSGVLTKWKRPDDEPRNCTA